MGHAGVHVHAVDGQARTFNAGELVEMFATHSRTGDIAFQCHGPEPPRWRWTWSTWRWPSSYRMCTWTYSWSGVHDVPKTTLRDARLFRGIGSRQNQSIAVRPTLTRYWRSTTADDHLGTFRGYVKDFQVVISTDLRRQTGSRQIRWIDSHRARALEENAAANYPRLFDFGDVGDSVWASGSEGASDAYFKPGNIRSVPFVYGRWVTAMCAIHSTLTTARRTAGGKGRHPDRSRAGKRIPTDTYGVGRIVVCIRRGTDTAAYGPQHISFYRRAVKGAIDSVVRSIGVPRRSTHTPTSPSAATPLPLVHHGR
jgi:hypothetical protein